MHLGVLEGPDQVDSRSCSTDLDLQDLQDRRVHQVHHLGSLGQEGTSREEVGRAFHESPGQVREQVQDHRVPIAQEVGRMGWVGMGFGCRQEGLHCYLVQVGCHPEEVDGYETRY